MPPIHEPLTMLEAVRFALPRKISPAFTLSGLHRGCERAEAGCGAEPLYSALRTEPTAAYSRVLVAHDV